MVANGFEDEIMIQRIKEGFDVEVDDPVGTPAAATSRAERIVRRFAKAVPIRVYQPALWTGYCLGVAS